MSAFVHDALLYDGPGAFVEHMLPFVQDGLDAGDAVLAVTSDRNTAALREALNGDAGRVDFRDSIAWYESPGTAFRRYDEYIAATGGTRLRVIGEPVWPVGNAVAVVEWARYESLLNSVLEQQQAWIVCPYDASVLPDEILEHARHTHPALHSHGGRSDHEAYVDPREYWRELGDDAFETPPGARSVQLTSDLAAMRAVVAVEASRAGVADARLGNLLIAVHELAINALTHGGGGARVSWWRDEADFVCELTDRGPGITTEFPGYALPAPEAVRGRGIWLARQLCDLVRVRSTPTGTQVRLHVACA